MLLKYPVLRYVSWPYLCFGGHDWFKIGRLQVGCMIMLCLYSYIQVVVLIRSAVTLTRVLFAVCMFQGCLLGPAVHFI